MDLATILSVGAAIIIALVTVVGFIIKIFPRNVSWKEPINKIGSRLDILETRFEAFEKELGSLTTSLVQESERTDKEVDRLTQKIEKLTDLMIKMISDGFK